MSSGTCDASAAAVTPSDTPRREPLGVDEVEKNREIEARWRAGQISDQAFDWWLRSMSGV
jgi:hypothetical protein